MASHHDKALVTVSNIRKSFGSVLALDDLSLSVSKGEMFGLVGSDGAGKTTLLRIIAGMIAPDVGLVSFAGVAGNKNLKHFIGYMPQRFGLYPDLSVRENMTFFMDIFGIQGAERQRRQDLYLGFSNLLPFIDRRAKDLSGGMKQKLGLACVLVHEPQLLILDEPTNGVDPISRREFWEILQEMKKQGKTIIVSTAYLDEGELCERIALMHKAKILSCAPPREIIATQYKNLEEAVIAQIAAEEQK
ncbi:MAG: ABC transporter ATP-binding protein [Deltaproteobacteria bacterium]|nr:ABC transporter ATP-binding protein [Deltaproteobacteria bacterium]